MHVQLWVKLWITNYCMNVQLIKEGNYARGDF